MDLRSAWRVVNSAGKDITDQLRPHLEKIQVTDNPGRVSDSASFTLAGANDFPQTGQPLTLYLGDPLTRCGVYYVAEFEEQDDPELLTVTCRAVFFGGDITESGDAPVLSDDAVTAQYEDQTLGEIGALVAQRLGVVPAIDPDFADYTFDYVEQIGESDPRFIQRLAMQAGAIAKLTGEALAIGSTHSAESFRAREDMPNVVLGRDAVQRGATAVFWSVRTVPSSVKALWYNPKNGQRGSVTASTGKPQIQLVETFPSEDQASAAANRRLDAAVRRRRRLRTRTGSLNAQIWSGTSLTLQASEWRPNFVGQWSVLQAVHTLNFASASSETTITAELEANG